MTVRRWIGTLALALAMALPSTAFARNTVGNAASPAQKAASKTKSAAHKGGSKAAKTGDKTKGNSGEAGDTVTDAWITMKIKTDFVKENTLKGGDLTVETKDKVVTLKGTVASAAAKARAEQIAKDTQGVTKVVDNLTVK